MGSPVPSATRKNHLTEMCQVNKHDTRGGARFKHDQKAKCKKRDKVHEVEDYESDDSIYSLSATTGRRQYFARLKVQVLSKESSPIPLRVQLDSGATCSVMSIDDYRRITGSTPPPPSASNLKLYDGSLLKPVGADTLHCSNSGVFKKVHFKIVDKAPTPLL